MFLIMKLCSRCKKPKENRFFSRDQRYCKKCRSEYSKENRPRINKSQKAWYHKTLVYQRNKKTLIARQGFIRSNQYRSLMHWAICYECATRHDLVAHHKDENPLNNVLSNIQVLCRSCHSIHHKTKLVNVEPIPSA